MVTDNLNKFGLKNYVSLIFVIILVVVSFNVPVFSPYKYSDQNLELVDIPPILKIQKISNNYGIYVHKDLYPLLVSNKGRVLARLSKLKTIEKTDIYIFNNQELGLDCNEIEDFTNIDYSKIKLTLNNKVLSKLEQKIVWNKSNIFGTDQLGRDVFTRVFQGIKISLIIGLVASVVNLVIGVLYGGIAGYKGGKLDDLMMGILNVVNSIPPILVVILLALFVPQGIYTVVLTIGAVYWVAMARHVRAQVMVLKERDFVLAEILMGTPRYKIIFKHIMPNVRATILSVLIVNVQNAIFTESFLSFLGIGLPAPVASLGTLINDSISSFRSSSYQLIIPSIALVLIFILLDSFSFNKVSYN